MVEHSLKHAGKFTRGGAFDATFLSARKETAVCPDSSLICLVSRQLLMTFGIQARRGGRVDAKIWLAFGAGWC
jgi:hypothetical protein